MLTALETTATIGPRGELLLDEQLPTGVAEKVRVIVFLDEELGETEWLHAASASEAVEFLNDPAEDIYTLADGNPLDEK